MSPTPEAPAIVERVKGHTDPAAALRADVPVQTRSARPTSFDPEDFAVPTGREVNWKHTPVARLADLFRDEDDAAPISVTVDDAAPFVGELGIGDAPRGEFFRPEDRASAIAWKRSERALHVRIPREHEASGPIRIDVRGESAESRSTMQVVIEAEPHSRATVILDHRGTALLGQNVEILVRDGAALTVISVQRWEDDAVHAAAHQARVDRDGFLRHFVVTFGGGIVRVNPSLELAGTGSEGEMYGLAFADSGQHLESQVYLHHKGSHTRGDVLYKGALQGSKARTVWIGDVLIGPDAVGTDSYEANRNLLLTEGARADSIPNLEIETGDIQGAGHASATGRFDDEQLFYLQARGISEAEARRLVVIGFLAEIVQKLGVEDLESELLVAVESELAKGQQA